MPIAEELRNIWWDLKALARHHFDKSEVLYGIRGEPELIALPAREIGCVEGETARPGDA